MGKHEKQQYQIIKIINDSRIGCTAYVVVENPEKWHHLREKFNTLKKAREYKLLVEQYGTRVHEEVIK